MPGSGILPAHEPQGPALFVDQDELAGKTRSTHRCESSKIDILREEDFQHGGYLLIQETDGSLFGAPFSDLWKAQFTNLLPVYATEVQAMRITRRRALFIDERDRRLSQFDLLSRTSYQPFCFPKRPDTVDHITSHLGSTRKVYVYRRQQPGGEKVINKARTADYKLSKQDLIYDRGNPRNMSRFCKLHGPAGEGPSDLSKRICFSPSIQMISLCQEESTLSGLVSAAYALPNATVNITAGAGGRNGGGEDEEPVKLSPGHSTLKALGLERAVQKCKCALRQARREKKKLESAEMLLVEREKEMEIEMETEMETETERETETETETETEIDIETETEIKVEEPKAQYTLRPPLGLLKLVLLHFGWGFKLWQMENINIEDSYAPEGKESEILLE
jgi:hypothetical protein